MDWDGYDVFLGGAADGVPPKDQQGYTYGVGIGGDLAIGNRFGVGIEFRYERFEATGGFDANIFTTGITFPIWF